MPQHKVLFLYTELAGYLLASLKAWGSAGHQATVVHWPVNPEAPFILSEISGIEFIDRSTLKGTDIRNLIKHGGYEAIACSGWIDKGYVLAIMRSGFKGPRILLMDNQWTGSAKQRALTAILSTFFKQIFGHAWVAGDAQAEFAAHLGIEAQNIRTGFYSADISLFRPFYDRLSSSQSKVAKKFYYVGRYVEHKGIHELWEAFEQADQATHSDWELVCIGTGDEFKDRKIHDKIAHLGFKQPDELTEVIDRAGVFVLPSHFEPWGVVVHEFAAAGFPMIVSSAVGSAARFVDEGKNGWTVEPGDINELKSRLIWFMEAHNDELLAMSEHSHSLGSQDDQARWVDTLADLL